MDERDVTAVTRTIAILASLVEDATGREVGLA